MQFVADYPGLCEKLILLASASTRGYPFYGIGESVGLSYLENRLTTYEEIKAEPMAKTILYRVCLLNKGPILFKNCLEYTYLYEFTTYERRNTMNISMTC